MINPFMWRKGRTSTPEKTSEEATEKATEKASENKDNQRTSLTETSRYVEKKKTTDEVDADTDGMLDMVIAFDTTGSMAAYIDDVRQQVADLVPHLFADNKNLRLGIVAFGDYCDMKSAQDFGKAYQCIQPTDDCHRIVDFVKHSEDTSGGDGDEFYELVIKKIVEETPWREDAEHAVLLIADAYPHELGYTYQDRVVDNRIDWKEEAHKAASRGIKIDTVMVEESAEWMKTLSKMTNGICVPFVSSHNTARLVEAATFSRGSMKQRRYVEEVCEGKADVEIKMAIKAFAKERHSVFKERHGERVTPFRVDHLEDNEIFVFGSNAGGFHSGGAAGQAMKHYGAVWGKGEGLQGRSYAIPTMDGLEVMEKAVKRFISFAAGHPELRFLVTRIGCGIAGYSDRQVAPFFAECTHLENVALPAGFWEVLE